MLHAHGDHIDADDEGDEKVQVVAGAQSVDPQAQGRVVSIVGPLLGLWSTRHTQTNKYTTVKAQKASTGTGKIEVQDAVICTWTEGAERGHHSRMTALLQGSSVTFKDTATCAQVETGESGI